MKKINLRELYPDVYITDFFVDVTEEVMETIRAVSYTHLDVYKRQVQDKAVNTKGVQLIFTTHDAMLLDLNFFRRDQIWFAEKNDETCATELYSCLLYTSRCV